MRKLKFLLARHSLVEIIYISATRPRLEYANVVWNNCTRYEVNALEKIQLEAARIVTGGTKLVSLEVLYNERGWVLLETRRSKHKMCLFCKMNKSNSPNYLSSLVHNILKPTTHYSLRDATNIRQTLTRTQLYYNSFIPPSIRLSLWDDLPSEMRESITYTNFKYQINRNIRKPSKYYMVYDRFAQIQHTRLRTSCSSLNHHLFS